MFLCWAEKILTLKQDKNVLTFFEKCSVKKLKAELFLFTFDRILQTYDLIEYDILLLSYPAFYKELKISFNIYSSEMQHTHECSNNINPNHHVLQ